VARIRSTVLAALPLPERRFIADALRTETLGGLLLLGAAVVALVWANSPWYAAYESLRALEVGPAALDLHLDLLHWAADGLLAIFFYVAGLELKRELVVGQLREPSAAVLPVVAAVCGMVVPALVYLAVSSAAGGDLSGWAVPTATDIAFALAVLAVIGAHLPSSVRAFLLTLAVVDDLGAILVIAVVFTETPGLLPLAGAGLLLAGYAYLQHRRVRAWWVYVPLALTTWALVHASGVHATIAGVALGLLTRVRPDPDEPNSPAERLEHRLRPLSAGVAVPAFALMSAGVAVSAPGLREALGDGAALGIVAGLVVGKVLGVLGGTYLTARLTRAELHEDLDWADVAAVGLLSGIGFTVSLLIGELAFAGDAELTDRVTLAVLAGSLLSALAAAVLLRARNKHYQRLWEEEQREALDEQPAGVASGTA